MTRWRVRHRSTAKLSEADIQNLKTGIDRDNYPNALNLEQGSVVAVSVSARLRIEAAEFGFSLVKPLTSSMWRHGLTHVHVRARPQPDRPSLPKKKIVLVTVLGVAKECRLSLEHAKRLVQGPNFPDARTTLGLQRMWDVEEVLTFIRHRSLSALRARSQRSSGK
jgi:hypothetical protein